MKVLAAAVVAAALLLFAPGALAAELPDLEQVSPYHMQIVEKDGHWYLGFAGAVRNVGTGSLRLVGNGPGDGTMTVQQLADDGSVLAPNAGVFNFVTTYGHHHWHYMDFMKYELRGKDIGSFLPDHKQGFCLASAPFVDGWCSRDEPWLTSTELGMQPGGVDIYEPNVEGQEIEIDPQTTPSGRYVLTSRIGPTGVLQEARTDNNSASTELRIQWPLKNGQEVSAISACEGFGCAGPLPKPKLRRVTLAGASALARRVVRRTVSVRPLKVEARCRRTKSDRHTCRVRALRGHVTYTGKVRLRYVLEGAATRWRYRATLVRRVGTSRHTRSIRVTERLGGTLPRTGS